MKSFIKVSLFAVVLAFAPMFALAAAALYLMFVAPVFFGVMFMSALLITVLKSLVASVVITTVACIYLAARYMRNQQPATPEEVLSNT